MAVAVTLALSAAPVVAGAATPPPAPPFKQCPPTGAETSCQFLVVVNADGTTSITMDASVLPYDGSNSALIGVRNDSGKVLLALTFAASGQGGGGFAFTGGGPCQYVPTPPACANGAGGPSGYSGPNNTFSDINADGTQGTVNFTGGLGNGKTTWFAIAQALEASEITLVGAPVFQVPPTTTTTSTTTSTTSTSTSSTTTAPTTTTTARATTTTTIVAARPATAIAAQPALAG